MGAKHPPLVARSLPTAMLRPKRLLAHLALLGRLCASNMYTASHLALLGRLCASNVYTASHLALLDPLCAAHVHAAGQPRDRHQRDQLRVPQQPRQAHR